MLLLKQMREKCSIGKSADCKQILCHKLYYVLLIEQLYTQVCQRIIIKSFKSTNCLILVS